MQFHDPNSRGSRIALKIVAVMFIFGAVMKFMQFTQGSTSNVTDATAGFHGPAQQLDTLQSIRQTAQDSITFAQNMENPEQYETQIECVRQYMNDYDFIAQTREIQSITTHNPVQRALGMLNRHRQEYAVSNLQNTARNLDEQTKALLSAVDAAMSDDFSQHAGQWLMQVDDATQGNELIDRYGKNRSYQSMREMLTDLQSLQTLRSTVKQQVTDAIANLHNSEQAAAMIPIPDQPNALDANGWLAEAQSVAGTMGVQINETDAMTCGNQQENDPSGLVAGYFCQTTDDGQRNTVHLLTTHPDWNSTMQSPWLVDIVKHELAHRSIMISCGTTQPAVTSGRTEAVTNSYSALFLGADRGRIAAYQQTMPEYAMDEQSDQIATAIHDGNCG